MRTRNLLFVFLLVTCGCKCEGSGVRKAFDKFVGFAQGEDQTKEFAEKPAVYKVRSRKEEAHLSRSRVIAHIEVDPGIDHTALKEVLRDACHDQSIAGGASVLKVIAWPGNLQRLVNPLGTAIFARDGKGWEGTGVGFEEIHVGLPPGGGSPLSEKEYLRAMTVDSMLGRGKTFDEAVNTTAKYHDASPDDVRDAILKAQTLFGKPSDQPAP
jgi:hypothetical protein